MKKFIMLILFILPVFVYAKDIPLDNVVISFSKIEDYDLQGFTLVKDRIFAVLNSNDEKAIIKVYSLPDYKEVYSKEVSSLGHANDVTYDSLNNIIYVLASSGSSIVYAFDGNDYSFIKEVDIGYPARSITYIPDKDMYAIRTVSLGYLLNSDFTPYKKFPFIVGISFSEEVGRQGWTYYNSYIYYSNWSWIRYGGDGTNIIYLYNLEGDLIEEYNTPGDVGELEDVVFYNNKMILGINGYNNHVYFYEEDIPEVTIINNDKVVYTENVKKNYNYVYYICGIVIIFYVCYLLYLGKRKSN